MKRLALTVALLLLTPTLWAQEADDSTPETDPIEVQTDKDQPRACGPDGSDVACIEETLMSQSASSLCCSTCQTFASGWTCVFVYHCNTGC